MMHLDSYFCHDGALIIAIMYRLEMIQDVIALLVIYDTTKILCEMRGKYDEIFPS
jgi:hypothetical protein